MTRENFLTEMSEHRKRWGELREAAGQIALDMIREHFHEVPATRPQILFLEPNDVVRLRPEYDETHPEDFDFYEVDLRVGTILYIGPDLRCMFAAAALNPAAYTVEQRGNTAIFVVWRDEEAQVLRFNAATGEKTGAIIARNIYRDEGCEYCTIGRERIYKGQ